MSGHAPGCQRHAPDTAAAPDLAEVAGRFGDLLHAAGVPATPERSGRFAAAVEVALPARNDELYWLARVALLSGHEQVPVFDRVFAQVFGGLLDVADPRGDTSPIPDPNPTPGEGEGGTAAWTPCWPRSATRSACVPRTSRT